MRYRLEAHAAHSPHATHAAHSGGSRALLLGRLDDGDLGGTEQGGDTASIDQGGADDLEGIQDTGGNHVDVLALGAVEALVEVVGELVGDLADNDGALSAGVLDDHASGAGDSVLDNGNTELLVEVGRLDLAEGVDGGLQETSATTGQDTLLNGGAGGVQGIDDAVLLLADLDLGGTTDLDDGNTARKLGKALLELLLLVLRGGGVSNDAADLLAALSNSVLGALAVQDDGVLLGDGDGAGGAEHVGGGLLELDIDIVAEDGTVGEDGDIAEDGLAVVTEAGGLDGGNLELATELVENADGQSLALDVLGDNDEGTAELLGGLQSGEDVLDGGDLALGKQDQRLLELDLGGLGVGDEVGGDVATVELHALGDLELVLNGLALLDGDDTLLADLLHGAGQELANVHIAVGGDGSDLLDLLGGGHGLGLALQVLDDGLNGGLGAAAQVHGVAAGSNVLHRLGEDGAGQHGGSGGAITSSLVGLGGDVLEQTRTKVLELVLERNGLGDRDTVCDDA